MRTRTTNKQKDTTDLATLGLLGGRELLGKGGKRHHIDLSEVSYRSVETQVAFIADTSSMRGSKYERG